jgi:hypothetical protein
MISSESMRYLRAYNKQSKPVKWKTSIQHGGCPLHG